ncbi:MAG: hypothetical protein WD226_06630 [Planctomycetota bacterium]
MGQLISSSDGLPLAGKLSLAEDSQEIKRDGVIDHAFSASIGSEIVVGAPLHEEVRISLTGENVCDLGKLVLKAQATIVVQVTANGQPVHGATVYGVQELAEDSPKLPPPATILGRTHANGELVIDAFKASAVFASKEHEASSFAVVGQDQSTLHLKLSQGLVFDSAAKHANEEIAVGTQGLPTSYGFTWELSKVNDRARTSAVPLGPYSLAFVSQNISILECKPGVESWMSDTWLATPGPDGVVTIETEYDVTPHLVVQDSSTGLPVSPVAVWTEVFRAGKAALGRNSRGLQETEAGVLRLPTFRGWTSGASSNVRFFVWAPGFEQRAVRPPLDWWDGGPPFFVDLAPQETSSISLSVRQSDSTPYSRDVWVRHAQTGLEIFSGSLDATGSAGPLPVPSLDGPLLISTGKGVPSDQAEAVALQGASEGRPLEVAIPTGKIVVQRATESAATFVCQNQGGLHLDGTVRSDGAQFFDCLPVGLYRVTPQIEQAQAAVDAYDSGQASWITVHANETVVVDASAVKVSRFVGRVNVTGLPPEQVHAAVVGGKGTRVAIGPFRRREFLDELGHFDLQSSTGIPEYLAFYAVNSAGEDVLLDVQPAREQMRLDVGWVDISVVSDGQPGVVSVLWVPSLAAHTSVAMQRIDGATGETFRLGPFSAGRHTLRIFVGSVEESCEVEVDADQTVQLRRKY